MAKGAVNGLTLSLAAELAPRVRVNALAPSLTRTPLAGAMLANERLAQSLAALHPLQRLGSPEDIAQATVFLLSGQSSWMTGQIVGVDGGRSTLRTNG
jgi:NAD(P)-dependent dehydrogenase (short-subunit alcohol dehydrogenase family)